MDERQGLGNAKPVPRADNEDDEHFVLLLWHSIRDNMRAILVFMAMAGTFTLWVVQSIQAQDKKDELQDQKIDVIARDLASIEAEQAARTSRVYHMDVIEERLQFISQSVDEMRKEVREMKGKLEAKK